MLEAMRQLALDYLFEELGEGKPPQDLTAWFKNLRIQHPKDIFPFLVENSGIDSPLAEKKIMGTKGISMCAAVYPCREPPQVHQPSKLLQTGATKHSARSQLKPMAR